MVFVIVTISFKICKPVGRKRALHIFFMLQIFQTYRIILIVIVAYSLFGSLRVLVI